LSGGRRSLVFRPFSLLYFALLLFILFAFVPIAISFLRRLLISGLGIPPEAVGVVLFLSLFGSFFNIPLTTIESRVPFYTYREVRFFGVSWRIPEYEIGVRKTRVTINLGGAIVPIALSAYLIVWSIPSCSPDPTTTYAKMMVVLIVVTLLVNRSARLIKGLGIATPALGPPVITALATLLIDWLSPTSCPTQIAYVGGTLGTLIGADLLNLHRLSELGAPVVSIGGAGTFDGIYMTGLVSVLLVLLVL